MAAGAPGDPCLPTLGRDLDIRTDLCRYKVFRNGELIDEPTDIDQHWRDDLVIFALGCSFSFEDALMQDGIELRHITNGTTVPMYRTSIPTVAAGPFHGPLVVSMRPLKPADAIRAFDHHAVSGRSRRAGAYRQAGADRHQGHHEAGLWRSGADERRRDPVFWACGVTPQSVVATVKPEFCITHYPGCMLVTDRKNSEFAIM